MYDYAEIRKQIFTEDGSATFMAIRDKAQELLKVAGAFTMQQAFTTGDSWLMMACIDRLVELKEIREIPQENVAGQNRVFVKR